MQPGDVIELSIEKAAAGGRMLARHEGQVVLVSGTIPGERVRARIERVRRDVLLAATVDVIEAHPARRDTNPDPACGGMTFAHMACEHQRAVKAQIIEDAFARIAKISVPAPITVAASPETGYRMRTRLHVRGGRLGSFREGSHDVCDIAVTGQVLDQTVAVVARLQDALERHQIQWLEAIEVAENLAGDERVIHVDEGRGPVLGGSALAEFANIEGVTGVTRAAGAARPIVVSGRGWVHDAVAAFAGASSVAEATLRRHAPSFFQANRFLAPSLAQAVMGELGDAPVVDLYAGVGLFAVCAAATRSARVTAVEGDALSAMDLRRNAMPFRDHLWVSVGSVEEFLAGTSAGGDATLIVDPPRTGISRAAMKGIVLFGAPRVVYVSCDVATLARDVKMLGEVGYRLDRVDAFDLFPNTPHVETLAVLDKVSAGSEDPAY